MQNVLNALNPDEYYILNPAGNIHSTYDSVEECLAAIQRLDNSNWDKFVRFWYRYRPPSLLSVFPMREPGRLPHPAERLFNEVRDETITRLRIFRSPLSSTVKFLLNGISFCQFKRAMRKCHYDQLFHLGLLIETENGRYIWEKTYVVQFYRLNRELSIYNETMDVNLQNLQNLEDVNIGTIQNLVDSTRERMGPERFSLYDGFTNNCQDFIISTLESLNLCNPETHAFIQQDVLAIFRTLLQDSGAPAWWLFPIKRKLLKFVARMDSTFGCLRLR